MNVCDKPQPAQKRWKANHWCIYCSMNSLLNIFYCVTPNRLQKQWLQRNQPKTNFLIHETCPVSVLTVITYGLTMSPTGAAFVSRDIAICSINFFFTEHRSELIHTRFTTNSTFKTWFNYFRCVETNKKVLRAWNARLFSKLLFKFSFTIVCKLWKLLFCLHTTSFYNFFWTR